MDTETIKQHIIDILSHMGMSEDVEGIDVHQGTASRFSIRMRGRVNMLIGEKGNNLIALDHIIKKIITRKLNMEHPKFTLDINDYRIRRLDDLKQDVKNAAKEVRMHHKEAPLKPMSAFERRIVHLLLAEYPDITTESIGEEKSRRVIIKPFP
jgi:spoIIIJ-associated protein